ncbi:495_t:CDS:1, partial [Ambispora gerdemannii]
QIANSILARCLVIINRLYEGKDEKYEKYLEELAKKDLKCSFMNPKNPEASLYQNREKLVNQALTGDKTLLAKIADLPYISE